MSKLMLERQRALYDDQTRDQFLVLTDVPETETSKLNDDAHEEDKLARICYNEGTQVLIVKLMAEGSHCIASRHFGFLIYDELGLWTFLILSFGLVQSK